MSARIQQFFPGRQLAFAGLAFAHLLLAITYVVSDSFTGSGFDESVIFFLHTGTAGLELSGYSYLIGSITLFIVLSLYICIKLGRFAFLNQSENRFKTLAINLALVAFLFAQPVFNVVVTQPLYSMIVGPPVILTASVIPAATPLPQRKNIVYLYLESFERIFLDDKVFPGLAPNLRRIEQQAISFSNIANTYGTNWTVAGMVSSQCGLPVPPLSGVNRPGEFMREAVCLGDILKQNGYTTSYLGGASMRFGAKGNFLETHGFEKVVGLETHLQQLPLGTTPYSHWGLYDDRLFQLAQTEYARLSGQDKPFAFMLLTLDTHPPKGYPSPSCEGMEYGDGSQEMLTALKCTDHLAGKFIDFLLSSDNVDNTIFVIASDHLIMSSDIDDHSLDPEQRRNLLLIIDKDRAARQVTRIGSTLDIAPTLLGLLGAKTQKYNLGVNLLGNETSLLEEIDNPDDALRYWAETTGQKYQP